MVDHGFPLCMDLDTENSTVASTREVPFLTRRFSASVMMDVRDVKEMVCRKYGYACSQRGCQFVAHLRLRSQGTRIDDGAARTVNSSTCSL